MWVRLLIITLIIGCLCFTCKIQNTSDWQASVDVTQKPKKVATSVNEKHSEYNTDFDMSYINEKFKGHYIHRALASGDIVRWNPETFPLKVYIENNPNLPEYFYPQIKKAFEAWQEASGNFITFKYVNKQDIADIRCIFPNDFNTEKANKSMITGYASYRFQDGLLLYSEIKFSKYGHDDNYMSEKLLYHTAVHEIGHSLGIMGHSINSSDIMHPSSFQDSVISSNDINTLKLIYSIVPDISNKEFSEEVKTKFLSAGDIFGGYDNRYKIELNNTKEDIQNSRPVLSKTLRLAYLYYKTKQYKQARDILEDILVKNPNERDTYIQLERVYNKQKDFEALDRLYKTANKNFPNNPPIKKN